jgi:hypothetical protein
MHMSVLSEGTDINKGLAAVLIAAEEKDLRGGFRLGCLRLQGLMVLLGTFVPILCTQIFKQRCDQLIVVGGYHIRFCMKTSA